MKFRNWANNYILKLIKLLISAFWGSTIESINNLKPPDQAHNSGYPKASFLTVSTADFLNYSSVLSAKATKELANNFGNVLGEISIHFLINLIDYTISWNICY